MSRAGCLRAERLGGCRQCTGAQTLNWPHFPEMTTSSNTAVVQLAERGCEKLVFLSEEFPGESLYSSSSKMSSPTLRVGQYALPAVLRDCCRNGRSRRPTEAVVALSRGGGRQALANGPLSQKQASETGLP